MKNRRKELQDHKGHSRPGYFVCCLLLCILLFLTTACGRDSEAGGDADSTADSGQAGAISGESNAAGAADQRPEYVYVPELITVKDDRVDYDKMQQFGDTLCYISMSGEAEKEAQSVCLYSITDQELSRSAIDWPMGEINREVCSYVFGPDHSVWLTVNAYPADYSRLTRYLCKFDPEGKNLFFRDITDQVGRDRSIGDMALDGQGRIYVFTSEYDKEAGIWMYTAEGDYQDYLSYSSSENVQVKGTADGEDGSFYVCISEGKDPDHCTLTEVDFENKEIKRFIEDFPNVNGLYAGTQAGGDADRQYDFLLYDDTSVCGYDLPAQNKDPGQAEELFAWGDSDINGYFVTNLSVLEDGRYFCTVDDWQHEDRGIVLLTRTRSEEVPQREEIVLASVDGGSDLAALAVRFSRNSDQYHLTVKNYDSLTSLYNALLAKEAIDMIDLSGVDVEKLVRQDVFADLTPWLEQSQVLDASDFLDGVLGTYTIDGTLVGIPESFTLRTVVGDGTLPGNAGGLSLDGLITAVREHPGAQPFDEMTKEEMMQYVLMFNEDTFIDWDTGECHFDSEQFKAVLELSRGLPDGSAGDGQNGSGSRGDVSMPTKIQNGQVLFAVADLWRLDTYQLYEGIFGENAACLGFPTPDGKGGTLLYPLNAYGIVAASEHQNGAWEFIEGVLRQVNVEEMEKEEVYLTYSLPSRFPALKETMDRMIEYKMEEDSQRQSNRYHATIYEEDGWYFQYHAVTWDEINVLLDLLKGSTPAFSVENDDIINIINEEAFAYYSGQKGIDDVVSIIQNRVQLYVSENR